MRRVSALGLERIHLLGFDGGRNTHMGEHPHRRRGVNFSPLGVCVSVFGVVGHSLITGGGRVRDILAKKGTNFAINPMES